MAAEISPHNDTGTKRPHSSSLDAEQQPTKRIRIHHKLCHEQYRPLHVEPAPQDQVFAQGQLLKSIGTALAMAGYDSVKPTALEMFRSHVEEYMLRFLEHARLNMLDGRRTKPVPLDFAAALSSMPNAATATLLKPQLDLKVPDIVSRPQIMKPDPAPPSAPDFSALLAPLTTKAAKTWIPKHFPSLPPRHAWRSTPDFPQREKDARKMREKATQEGMLAEQALRKLGAAAKTSAMNAERRRNSVLSGEGKVRDKRESRKGKIRAHEDTFADVLKDIGELDEVTDVDMDGTAENARNGIDLGMPEGVAVNHDMSHWRKGALRRK